MLSPDEVRRKYRSLKFNNMADSLDDLLQKAEDNEISYPGLADMFAEEELPKRERKRIETNLKRSGFPSRETLEEFDYRFRTTVTKREANSPLDFAFVDQRWNLIFIGPPGVGKTRLSVEIGEKAVQAGYKVLFKTAMELIEPPDLAEIKGELKKKINALSKFGLFRL